MNRIFFASLALAPALSALPCAESAGADLLSHLSVPTVVVTGARFHQSPADNPVGVQVLTAEDIVRSGAITIPDVLSKQAGIVVRDNAGSPNRQIDLRGFGMFADQNTLILVNGQRISENEQTPANLASISLADVDRIEILRGSGAVLYGSGATGGTINVITRSPAAGDRTGRIVATAGTYGTWGMGARGSVGSDRLAVAASVNHLASDNYRRNNDVREQNAQAELRWFTDRGPLSLTVSQSQEDLRLPSSRSAAQLVSDRRGTSTPNDSASLDATRVVLGGTQQYEWGSVAADLMHRDRSSQSFQFGGFNTIDSKVLGLSPRVRIPFGTGPVGHTLIAGIDWESWDFDNRITSFSYTGTGKQDNAAVYFQNTIVIAPDTTLSLGARQQRARSDIRESGAISTRNRNIRASELALRQAIGAAGSVYAKIGRSFRIANVDDVRCFCAGPANFLEPQTSSDREVGLDGSRPDYRWRVAYFVSKLQNEILFDPVGFRNVNLPPTQRSGLELEGSVTLGGNWTAGANYARTRARFRDGTFSGATVGGNEIPLVPKHKATLSLGYQATETTSLSATATYVGTQRFDNDQTNSFNAKMPAYTVVDFTVAHESGPWRLRGVLLNALDADYFSYGVAGGSPGVYNAYPAAGRAMLVNVDYNFDGR